VVILHATLEMVVGPRESMSIPATSAASNMAPAYLHVCETQVLS
jgi:hypothetical protein